MFQFLFCYILERKDKKRFKRDIIVLVSFPILFVSIFFLVNIGKEMSLPGFRKVMMTRFTNKHIDCSISILFNVTCTGLNFLFEDQKVYFICCLRPKDLIFRTKLLRDVPFHVGHYTRCNI